MNQVDFLPSYLPAEWMDVSTAVSVFKQRPGFVWYRNHKQAIVLEQLPEPFQCPAWIWQMLQHMPQGDDIVLSMFEMTIENAPHMHRMPTLNGISGASMCDLRRLDCKILLGKIKKIAVSGPHIQE